MQPKEMKLVLTDQRFSKLEWLCLAVILWVPHAFLDYQFHVHYAVWQIPGSKYFFFFLTLAAGLTFAASLSIRDFASLFSDRIVWLAGAFFLAGVLLSTNELAGLKSFGIWVLISSAILAAAIRVYQQDKPTQTLVLMVLVVPYLIPQLWACYLEAFGSLHSALFLDNTWHHEGTNRWRTLHSSANGFGFDAAIVTFVSHCILLSYDHPFRPRLVRAVFAIFLLVGFVALILSGTRAALLVALVVNAGLFFSHHSARLRLGAVLAAVLSFLLWNLSSDASQVTAYLRVMGDMDAITSGRWNAMVSAIDHVLAFPIQGLGFGSADRSFPISPSNLFYFMLPVEIGLMGGVAAGIVMSFPLWKILWMAVVRDRQFCIRNLGALEKFCLFLLPGIFTWLVAEFDVIRVSANNQLFVFGWVFVSLYAQRLGGVRSGPGVSEQTVSK